MSLRVIKKKKKIKINPLQIIFLTLGKIFFGVLMFLIFSSIVGLVRTFVLHEKDSIQEEYQATDVSWTPYPYVMFKGAVNTERNNKGGYNGVYPVTPKPADEYRVFVLGGSTVYFGTPTLPDAIMQEFHTRGYAHVSVYNFGVVSAMSSQELVTIVTEIADLQPDLIIQYDGVNDLYHPLYYDPRPGYPFNFLVYESSPLLYPEKLSIWKYAIYKNPIISILAKHFFPNQYMNFVLSVDSLRHDVGYGQEEWKNQIADIYTNNIKKAQIVSEAVGSEYIAFFQPTIFNKHMVSKQEEKILPTRDIPYFTELQEKIKNTMSVDEYSAVHFVDLTTIFDSYAEPIFLDVMHIDKKYNNVVAKAIVDTILTRFSIPSY